MAKKEMFLCDDCRYFNGKCEHESNKIIEVHKRIEKMVYICTERKKNCKFYVEK